ncbi:PREDICTED: cytochrome c oxidase assembly protein COX15-like [Prunus mume]|uniref:Cytochrome c oxidase assembly protein COX15-like n=1 Tax=Prunus mume TaxID=102107 RepID=A0ABM1LT64_PRUMU|nr:PREDICTED: cytochrome c oxidase assembly protein COX15-like [Prunus mume]
MSTVASVGIGNKEGLKLPVNEGPHAQKMVGIWLFGSVAWVFSMVILGGITRLTRSGLSMTDWKFTGGLPPLSDEDWLLEFEKYKQSPEYKCVNRGMSIEDFKFIYWMEYAHRIWGRALGIMFALPLSYFLRKGYITIQLGLRLSALFALGAGQGLIGWWMVKSGLEPASEYSQPRVSPYRLAAHLTSPFAIYCGLLWTGLSVVMPEPPSESLAWVHGAVKVKRLALPVSLLVGVTAVSGAFVAGNDAGHAYNTFPKMGDTWIPEDFFDMKPLIRNFFENTSTVQLDHRILATATLFSIGALWWSTRNFDIHPAVRSLIGSAVGMAGLQVSHTQLDKRVAEHHTWEAPIVEMVFSSTTSETSDKPDKAKHRNYVSTAIGKVEYRNPVSTAVDKAEHRNPVSTAIGKVEHRNPVSMTADKAKYRNLVSTTVDKAKHRNPVSTTVGSTVDGCSRLGL